ncbi:COX assembly mitochondrial protein homolog [Toxorhynchites rutilus septentrionalis]|uniref:COX assembly mitochondrial protein homolog n=1 Tax=Toxorhynchites rutilus septentrionalis TaxID=329112 RepID=UPI00247849B2|nr:COX assembly mitochondrial protein homolog [Toxorhynchites rutilus septentrionalis]
MAHAYSASGDQSTKIGLNQGGPHGLGDPNDKRLRKVEIDVLIPKIMRDRAKTEKCIPEVKEFEDCCKGSGILMAVKCQKQNEALKKCSMRWYEDETFKAECREMYLQERSEYRRTGIPKKFRIMNMDQTSQ